MKRLLVGTVTTLGILAMGCGSEESSDIRTKGMTATFTAVSDGSGTHAEAVLRVGGSTSTTFVKLTNGDTLKVTSGQEEEVLGESHLLDFYFYTGELTADQENAEFVFNFDRTQADEDAPNSRVTLPAPFAITAPAANAQQSRAQALTVTWSPSNTNDTMAVSVSGDCIDTVRRDVTGDPGTYTFNAGDIHASSGHTNDNCTGTITITRSRAGSVDPAYDGGSLVATQTRPIDILLKP